MGGGGFGRMCAAAGVMGASFALASGGQGVAQADDRARSAGVELGRLRGICVPAEADSAETEAAELLRDELGGLYKLELEVRKGAAPPAKACILVGRAAVRGGMISNEELAAVKHDGYVLKAADGRIALAGYARQGTIYAAWSLLRRLGLRVYPWYHGADGGAVRVFEPLPDARLKPFALADKPFFRHRQLRDYLDRGRWGVTLNRYVLGDPSRAANQDLFGRDRKPGYTKYKLKRPEWTGWFHTAAYLVPRDLYYADHPEYFAMQGGKRIPPCRYARCQICTTHPDVLRISARRALEWMDLQRDRRVFCVAPADTALCRCPRCLAADPMPAHTSDRMLRWVNHVADAARRRHPENLILTAAYMETVKPPVRIKPASNVVVMYCPWFWNSRATSEVSFDHPLNVIAMRELTAWTMRFPGQVGLYDYPTDCARGTAERVKLYAKHGVRHIYFNGPRGSRLHWLVSRLLWDPFEDIEALEAEFTSAWFGPAAGAMNRYYRSRRDAIERHGKHTRGVVRPGRAGPAAAGREYFARARELLLGAVKSAEHAGPAARLRGLCAAIDELADVLCSQPQRVTREDRDALAKLHQQSLALCGELKLRYLAKVRRQAFDSAAARLDARLKQPGRREAKAKRVAVRFDAADETKRWLSDGTQAKLISPVGPAAVRVPSGETLRGVRIRAPLSRLPVIKKGNIAIHAGRFYAERVFDPPLAVDGCHALELHLCASRDVPVTVYVDNVHSDVDLHAGEQIVRVDLRNIDAGERFDWHKWSKLARLAIDIWPQDNGYPFPKAEDVEIVLLAAAATNRPPDPAKLPHRGKAVWLSRFRPNVPRGVAVPRERWNELMQRQHYRHVGLDYGSKHLHERFRTWTEHRIISPIYAILTGAEAGELEREAARELQQRLAEAGGAKLPVNPPGLEAGANVGNVVLLGGAAGAAGAVGRAELAYVGGHGFVVDARRGRIAVAGSTPQATARGVVRYLESHGVRYYAPGAVRPAALSRGFLHELVALERPFFADCPFQPPWQLKAQPPDRAASPKPADAHLARPADVADAAKLARAIKDAARRGDRTVPPHILAAAQRSALARYLAAKLLWDPTADATRIIREFPRRKRTADSGQPSAARSGRD